MHCGRAVFLDVSPEGVVWGAFAERNFDVNVYPPAGGGSAPPSLKVFRERVRHEQGSRE